MYNVSTAVFIIVIIMILDYIIIARKKANDAILTTSVSAPSELFWHVQLSKAARRLSRKSFGGNSLERQTHCIVPTSHHVVYPARKCQSLSEADGLHLDTSTSSMRHDTQSLVQYFVHGMQMGERAIVSNANLYPFHNLKDMSSSGATLTWCPLLCHRFQKQCRTHMKHKTTITGGGYTDSDARAECHVLERVLKEARRQEAAKVKRRLAMKAEQQQLEHEEEQQEKHKSQHNQNEDDDDDDDEDLETPYAQNFGDAGAHAGSNSNSSDDDSDDDDDCYRASKTKEQIRRGDVIAYRSYMYVAGDKRGERTATVLEIRPQRNHYAPLVLDNREVLPPETQVKRIHKLKSRRGVAASNKGKPKTTKASKAKAASSKRIYYLEEHPQGLFRPIEDFDLTDTTHDNCPIMTIGSRDNGTQVQVERSTQDTHRSCEAKRVGDIVQRGMDHIHAKAAEMNLPVDMTMTTNRNSYKGKDKGSNNSKSNHQSRSRQNKDGANQKPPRLKKNEKDRNSESEDEDEDEDDSVLGPIKSKPIPRKLLLSASTAASRKSTSTADSSSSLLERECVPPSIKMAPPRSSKSKPQTNMATKRKKHTTVTRGPLALPSEATTGGSSQRKRRLNFSSPQSSSDIAADVNNKNVSSRSRIPCNLTTRDEVDSTTSKSVSSSVLIGGASDGNSTSTPLRRSKRHTTTRVQRDSSSQDTNSTDMFPFNRKNSMRQRPCTSTNSTSAAVSSTRPRTATGTAKAKRKR
jgi:hypothetical protein